LVIRFSSKKLGRKNRGDFKCAVVGDTIGVKTTAWTGLARDRRKWVAVWIGRVNIMLPVCNRNCVGLTKGFADLSNNNTIIV